MNIALWVVASLLALVFLAAGAMKAGRSKEALLADPRMGWAEAFDARLIRTIGGLEILGALGLVLPAVTGIAPVLVPLAATGLAVTMVGAAATHSRRRETSQVASTLVLLALLILVAWGRFGPYRFDA